MLIEMIQSKQDETVIEEEESCISSEKESLSSSEYSSDLSETNKRSISSASPKREKMSIKISQIDKDSSISSKKKEVSQHRNTCKDKGRVILEKPGAGL